MENAEGWPRAHYCLSSGDSTLGLDLYVNPDNKPLTEEGKRIVDRAMRALHTDLLTEATQTNPKNIAWKQRWLESANEMFKKAGLGPVYVREIDNKYCGPKCCPHRVWLLVTTPAGVIEVGWRKSVMVINWEGSDIAARAEDLFPNEDVTKDGRLIHAWGYEKAESYLKTLADSWRKPHDVAPKYHGHLDQCTQCRNNPFDLCAEGARLLQESASALGSEGRGR